MSFSRFILVVALAVTLRLPKASAQPNEFRQLSDQELLLSLNLPGREDDSATPGPDPVLQNVIEGLRDVGGALRVNALPQARAALVHYYRQRDWVSLPFSTGRLSRDQVDLRVADDLLEHRATLQGKTTYLGDPIDWVHPPRGMDRMSLRELHTLRHWLTLARAWRATGSRDYALELDAQVKSWTRAMAVPQFKVESWQPLGPAWDVDVVADRVAQVWPEVVLTTLGAQEFSDEARLALLKSLLLNCQYLMRFADTRGEAAIAPLAALSTAAILFPEFSEARHWRERSLLGLGLTLRDLYHLDGARFGLSMPQQVRELCILGAVARLAQANGVHLSKSLLGQLEASADYIAHLVRPDGTVPALGIEPAVVPFDSIRAVAEVVGRLDLTYVASQGREGKPPSSALWSAPYAGQHVLRSGWGAQDTYLRFDGGPLGGGGMPEDALSFELMSQGRTLIVDPQGGEMARPSPAHNLILVDGQGQRRNLANSETWARKLPLAEPTVDEKSLELVGGRYSDGFGEPEPIAVQHLRKVAWIKPQFLVIADALAGEGTHHLAALFHVGHAPVQIDEQHAVGWTCWAEGANIAVWCSQPAVWKPRVARDEFGAVLRFEAQAALPASVEFVLQVFEGLELPVLILLRLPGTTAEVVGLSVTHEEGAVELFVSHGEDRRPTVGQVRFAPPAGLILRDRQGNVREQVRVLP